MLPRHRSIAPFASRALVVATLGLGLGCRTPSTKLPIDEKPATTEDDTKVEGQASVKVDPLPVEAAPDLFPAETMGFIELSDPSEFLALLGPLDQIPEFSGVRSEVRSRLGVDPFIEEGWRQAGLDPAGPIGVGLLEIDAEAGFAYAKLSDTEAFMDLLDRLLPLITRGESLPATVEVGQGRMIRVNEELSIVIREGYVVGVFTDRPDRARRDYAATVATIDPREDLSHQPEFDWVAKRRSADDDGMIFVAPQAILAEAEREIGQSNNNSGTNYIRQELERARREGEPVEVIRDLERRLEEERQWQEDVNARQRAGLELAQRVFGSMGAAYFAGDLTDSGARFHGGTLIPGSSLIRDIFVPVTAESPLMRALDEPLLAGLDGHAKVDALVEVLDLLARAEGESLAEVNAEAQAELGVNILGDFIPALDGRGGLMLTESKPITPGKVDFSKPEAVAKSLGLAAYLGLSQPQVVSDMFDRLARNPNLQGVLSQAKRGSGWTLDVPEWRKVGLRVVGNELVISTDTGLADRIAKAKAGSQASVLADANHPMRGPVANPALRMYQRWTWLALTSTNAPYPESKDWLLDDIDSMGHPRLTMDEAMAVPKSKAFKKKLKEFDRLIEDINAHNRERARKEFELALEITESLGDLGMQVESLSDGLALHGLWQMAPGVNPIELGSRVMMAGSASADWAEYDRLMTRRYELLEELRTQRRADLDAAADKKG